ncbi:MAG TPA: NAD(+) synthase [Chloroflexota bacterium]
MPDSSSLGFVRIGAAVPPVRVTDFEFNRRHTLDLWRQADAEGTAVVFFPELGLSAYTAGDLHMDRHVHAAALESLAWLLEQAGRAKLRTLVFVGMPLFVHPGVYNVAVAVQGDRVLGVVPKAYLPSYGEFYERRQFRDGRSVPAGIEIDLFGQRVPFGMDLLFPAEGPNAPSGLIVGVEICEDGWVHLPPSGFQVSAGATICGNLSGSNFVLGKGETRHRLCWRASSLGKCAYVYTAAGPGESSSDLAFDAHALIYELGAGLAESRRFARDPQLILADVDHELLIRSRLASGTFGDCAQDHRQPFRMVPFEAAAPATFRPLKRFIERHPFVPKDPATLATRCWEVFEIQTNSLITRMEYARPGKLVLALSGGRDSTLAALACANALDQLGRPRSDLLCVSMPGLGTTARTRALSCGLAEALGAGFEEEDIREECYLVLRDQGHPAVERYHAWLREHGQEHGQEAFARFLSAHGDVGDVEFENVQARVRTLRVMTKANRYRGIEIGTGDLSEKALGWATFNGDSIAMYDLNPGIPKTLVEFVIRWVANERVQTWTADTVSSPGGEGGDELRRVLFEILDAPISPELLPPSAEGAIAQLTESTIGPFELHDFFLYWFVHHGTSPARILFLAEHAFAVSRAGEAVSNAGGAVSRAGGQGAYTPEELRRWLVLFFRRFFANQWKRNCTADGPKVGSVSLSPRGDWRMPSDAVVQSWIEEIEAADTPAPSVNGRRARSARRATGTRA